MSKQKREKEVIGVLDVNEKSFVLKSEPLTVGSGYSLSIMGDDEEEDSNPVIHVKTYGDVDVTKLRREIKRKYPKAKIKGLKEQPLILVGNRKEKENLGKKNEKGKDGEKKELIGILDEER
jgi:hypothetical protein